jgi:ABC-type phosphate/phosphonate transport system substrate-binding protein
MIATLAMYDHPRQNEANDKLWQAIRAHLNATGIDAPETLTRKGDKWANWQHKELILGHACGLPFKQVLHTRVNYVGTFDYDLPGTDPGYYRSFIIVRADDPRQTVAEFNGSKLAYNDSDSQSGWGALRAWATANHLRLVPKLITGAHVKSAKAVSDGRADIASVDAVTWRAIQSFEPFADKLRVLDETSATPGLPLICAERYDPTVVRNAVDVAVDGMDADTQAILGINGVVSFPVEVYLNT